MMTTPMNVSTVRCGVLLVLSLIVHPTLSANTGLGATPTSFSSGTNSQATEVIISIKSREFTPNTVSVPIGQKTRLVLKNFDTELHAFIPVGLLTNTHLNIRGNGAPQFSKEGLVRVLLPTSGQTEIVFVPSQPGTFPYFCDLPGHEMRGTIVVHKNEDMIE